MKRLKRLVRYIWDEAMGAAEYASCALNNKDEDRSLAEAYISMAMQELSHAETLCSHAARIAHEHPENEHIEHIWEWEHDKLIERMAHARILIDMYRK